ncbi:MAG TPA: hypothetical protein VHO03_20840 [Ignavibacteriales bacterium]|nr:hypothetical protein [Ignavibacteriales bacterium]
MKILKLLILFLSLSFSGCIDLFGPDGPDQKYLFDVYYVNNAWGFVLNGIYIDKSGDVYSYSISQEDHISDDTLRVIQNQREVIKEGYLDLRYSFKRKFVKNIDPVLVRKKLADLYRIPLKAMSDTLGTGADMGAYIYTGYRFNGQDKTYERVDLKVTGDISYSNTSQTALDLVKWLDSELHSGGTGKTKVPGYTFRGK